ncbi:equilibrative nucleoside transporter 3-like [Aphidius gifuensis]|uniref:equilibrative nucleoside transporter 3-like n=1 Tax=Aphidius gifuensis TaxID=684658 RepID=UPI001CDBA03C|nr:equilibrative nucleoside transporter 3-like [Aphidius gifuensis]
MNIQNDNSVIQPKDQISIRIRVITTLLLILILFIITTVFVEIDTDKRQNEFLISTLTTASAGLNGADAVFAGTMFSVAGNFPSKYISSMSLGQAISGIFAAIFQILSLWLSTGPIEFFKYHMKEKVTIKNSDKSIDDTPSSSDNNSVSYIKIIVKIWPYGLSIFLTFFITYLVYPGVNSLVKSESSSTSEWSDKYFVPVATFLTFSIGDYFGCLYSRYSSWVKFQIRITLCKIVF